MRLGAICGLLGCEEGVPKVKTNADRIRSMTDEELADILNAFIRCTKLIEKDWDCNSFEDCKECRNAWLRKEVTE